MVGEMERLQRKMEEWLTEDGFSGETRQGKGDFKEETVGKGWNGE